MDNKIEIEKLKNFENHKLVLFFYDKNTKLKGFIAIHNTNLGPGLGGTRFWNYKNESDALDDVLRLSKAMTYKCAISGVKGGGAKAVLIGEQKIKNKKFLEKYAEIINILNGNFYTGEDVGITQEDVEILRKKSKYIIGSLKKSGSPSPWTALSVYKSIKAALFFLFKNSSFKNRLFAIKGIGKVGSLLIKYIMKEGGQVIAADIDKNKIKKIKKYFPQIKIVNPTEIHKQMVDVYSPCALGNDLNKKNVKELNCKIICGAANNQLADKEAGDLIFNRGIIYIPDYLANCGGLINVASELEKGGYSRKKVYNKINLIYKKVLTLLKKSSQLKKPTNLIINKMAEKIFMNPNKK